MPLLGQLPAVQLSSIPLRSTAKMVVDLRHLKGMPDARLQHALQCLMGADGVMSLLVRVLRSVLLPRL